MSNVWPSPADKPSLQEVRSALDAYIVQEQDRSIAFTCPLHDDGNPSGWLTFGYDPEQPEKYSVRCFGCEGDDAEWFGDFIRWMNGDAPLQEWSSKQASGSARSSSGHTRDWVCRYIYRDATGSPVACKDRWNLTSKPVDGTRFGSRVGKTFTWDRSFELSGARAPLYRLNEVAGAGAAGQVVYMVEGEKDADTLAGLGYVSTTSPNGAGSPLTDEHILALSGLDLVVIADNDRVGIDHARAVREQVKSSVRSIVLKVPRGFKDVTEVHEAGHSILENLELLHDFPPHLNPLEMDFETMQPKFLLDEAGRAMIYPGEIHLIYGKPGTCKSWLLLKLSQQCDAKFLDFENGAPTIAGRLRALRAPESKTAIFDFPETRQQVRARVAEYVETKPDVVCIDGLPGLTRVFGVNSDINAEIEKLYAEVLFPLKSAGIATVILDHLPKDAVNEDFPIGAQAKKSQSGVAYLLKLGADPQHVSIYVAKDRHSQVERRADQSSRPKYYGSLVLTTEDEGVEVSLRPLLVPELENLNDEEMVAIGQMSNRDANLRASIWDFVSTHADCSLSDLERGVIGKTSAIRTETRWLMDHGYITRNATGVGYQHRVDREFKVSWKPSGDSTAGR